jgi:hypothetical protein
MSSVDGPLRERAFDTRISARAGRVSDRRARCGER